MPLKPGSIQKLQRIFTGWLVTLVLTLMCTTASAHAQSTDRNNPTRLSVSEISGAMEKEGVDYYYTFTAGPGDVEIAMDIESIRETTAYAGVTMELFYENSSSIFCCFLVQSTLGKTERGIKKVNVGRKQTLLMRLSVNQGSVGTYRVRLSGAVGLQKATPPAKSARDSNDPSSYSTDRDNPTRIRSGEIKGALEREIKDYYYTFMAGPGELTITLSVESPRESTGYGGVTLDLFYENSEQVFCCFIVQSIQGKLEREVKKVQISRRQPVLLRASINSGSAGTFSIQLGGAVEFTQPDPRTPDTPRNNDRPAGANTTAPAAPVAGPSKIDVLDKGRRVALVIGNTDYKDAPLRNPMNDARDMTNTLGELGFEVVKGENLTKREIEDRIREFGKRLNAQTIGLFYFSGHAVQVNGQNYLIPVGYTIEKEQDVPYEAVDVGRVIAEMEAAGNRLNIVVLDACRNNPFARSFRSASRGLAVVNAPSGTVIAYSTAPGSVASDGEGRNGLYTQELLTYIREPGLKLEDVLKRVRVAVREKSNGKQLPWESSSIDGDFYFVRRK